MKQTTLQKLFIVFIVIVIAAVIVVWIGADDQSSETPPATTTPTSSTTEPAPDQPAEPLGARSIIGSSVEGRGIAAYRYGSGPVHLLLVGGIHGGYEWNSTLLSYEIMNWLEQNANQIPENMAISVVPTANPDGLFAALGTAGRFARSDLPADTNFAGPERFNANSVDLNRNFDCNWAPTSTWRGQQVSAGTAPFSEPEARAIRDHVANFQPAAALFYHSAAGAVYGAACDGTIGPGTKTLLDTYANAAGYRSVDIFDAYPITGAVEDWLTSIGIPAVTVELSDRSDTEFRQNIAGLQALFARYGQ